MLIEALGPDVVDNLARTARLVATDLEALDELAEAATPVASNPDGTLDVEALVTLPAALRTRVLRGFAQRLGVPGSGLASVHIDAMDALVTDWHGQGPVALPGGIQVARRAGKLTRLAA
jgi:tRNA(Ile)-lysidine synthase